MGRFQMKRPETQYEWVVVGFMRAADIESIYKVDIKASNKNGAHAFEIRARSKSGATYIVEGRNVHPDIMPHLNFEETAKGYLFPGDKMVVSILERRNR